MSLEMSASYSISRLPSASFRNGELVARPHTRWTPKCSEFPRVKRQGHQSRNPRLQTTHNAQRRHKDSARSSTDTSAHASADTSTNTSTSTSTCSDCVQGHMWEGTPLGSEISLADVTAYVTSPPPESLGNAGAILFIHDVFGWTFVNSRLLCDYIAKESGFTVYLPDFFRGETVISPDAVSSTDPSLWGKIQQGLKIAASIPNFLSLVQKYGPDKTQPALDSVVQAIKKRHGGEGCNLGAVGYCWGGKYVLRLGAQGKLAATVACHPSLLKPSEDQLANTSAATLFICAGNDNMFTEKSWRESEELIRATGVPLERVVFPGTKHGFAIRCDESDTVGLKAKDEAARWTAQWFKKYLS